MDKISSSNLLRTALSGVKPLLRRNSLPVMASVRQDFIRRDFVSSPKRFVFAKDSLFGNDYRPSPRQDQTPILHFGESESPPIEGHVSTEEVQVRDELSADYKLKPRYLREDKAVQVQKNFDETFVKLGGTLPLQYPNTTVTTALGFSTLRNTLKSGRLGPYVKFSREIIKNTLARQGTHNFHTGYMCMHRHFRDMVLTEIHHGEPIAGFAARATLHRDLRPPQPHPTEGRQPAFHAAPTITGVELIDSMEGPPKEWYAQARKERGPDGAPPFAILSSMGKPLDLDQATRLHDTARELCLSDDNKAHFKDSGFKQFSPAAKQAVEALQEFLTGNPKPLPEDGELRADPDLGADPSRWRNNVI